MSGRYNEVPQDEGQIEKMRTTVGTDSSWRDTRQRLTRGLALLGLLSIISLGMFFLSSYLHRPQRFFPDSTTFPWYERFLLTSTVPTQYVAFTETKEFMDPGATGDQAWQSMMPRMLSSPLLSSFLTCCSWSRILSNSSTSEVWFTKEYRKERMGRGRWIRNVSSLIDSSDALLGKIYALLSILITYMCVV